MVLAELGGKLRESLRKLHSQDASSSSEQDHTARVTALVGEIARALIESDVNVKLVMKLRDNILQKAKALDASKAGNNLPKLVQQIVVDELVALVTPTGANKPYTLRRGKPNILLFVGLQGAGKTTTLAKFAAYHAKRGYKVCLVCADTFRAGALDQLRQNATKLRIPFYGSHTTADPVAIASAGVSKFVKDRYELILVDTSGRHRQEGALLEEMQDLAAAIQPHNTILVMDATQGQAVFDQAAAFHAAVGVGGVIVTKLDGHAKGGGALSAVAAANAPILFLGSGEHFDDLEPFEAQSFVSKLLGFGDVRGFVKAIQEVSGGKKSQQELVNKMEKGQFTIRDMYQQFQNFLNLGPLQKYMGGAGGMPGLPQGDQGAQQLRRFMVIMDSMTDGELDGKVDFHKKFDDSVESRIRRIASGSGCHPDEVRALLQQHKQTESFFVKMGKSGMVGKQAQARQAQFAQQVKKNPNLIHQRLNQMDPKVIQQMGGRDKVLAMMQQVAKGGGGGGPGSMDPFGGDGGGGFLNPGAAGGMGGMPDGMPAGMDMSQIMKMAQAMGLGGGAGGGATPGAGGFPGFPGSGR